MSEHRIIVGLDLFIAILRDEEAKAITVYSNEIDDGSIRICGTYIEPHYGKDRWMLKLQHAEDAETRAAQIAQRILNAHLEPDHAD